MMSRSCGSNKTAATCHTARATIDLLKDTFGDRLISRFGPVNWPPRSCDLTPLDYFLWGYVKSLVYADKPQTLDHLEDNIRRVIADIRPQMLEKSSKIGRLDWATSEPAVAVLCQKSYLKCRILISGKWTGQRIANHNAAKMSDVFREEMALNRRFLLGVWTVNSPQSHIVRVYDAGHCKVVFSILLSGMMAIGRAMESGRRGYGSSSGWKV
ncbi:hypothetical protein TNCV_4345751 [Trichonephila clavipes]|nr:hypothetical protein TNCV_4345751 [Trichonephila clavipes]